MPAYLCIQNIRVNEFDVCFVGYSLVAARRKDLRSGSFMHPGCTRKTSLKCITLRKNIIADGQYPALKQ